MKNVQPGTYPARVVDWGIGETKSGLPQAIIMLRYTDNDNDAHTITWYGSFKEGKAREITIQAILNCGFKGENILDMAKGIVGGVLDTESNLSIVLENEKRNDGKEYVKVRWINRPMEMKNRVEYDEATAKFGSLRSLLTAEVVRMRGAWKGSSESDAFMEKDLPF